MKQFAFTAFLVVAVSLAGFRSIDTDSSEAQDSYHEVVIRSGGNELKFEQTAFTVHSGEQVHLVFENTATVQGMSHNVVIVNNEEAINRVGLAAISAVENDYIPEDASILFFTALAAPGETVELTFTSPEPGTYFYTCTFPGHYVLMRGVMTVMSAE